MPNCVVCGKDCARVTCSEECRHRRANDLHNERKRKRRAEAAATRPKKVCTCTICGKDFEYTSGKVRKTCGATNCQLEYRRQFDIERYGRVAREFDCPICGKHVVTCRKSQETCGADACYDKLYRDENSDELREKRAEQADCRKAKPTDCPWANGWFDDFPQEIKTWDCGQMDPMTNRCEPGVWVEVLEIKECAA